MPAFQFYRSYLVWGCKFRVIAFPCVLLLGSTGASSFLRLIQSMLIILVACGIGILYSFAKVVPEAEIFVDELQNWIVSFFSLTLATNIICTGKYMPICSCYFHLTLQCYDSPRRSPYLDAQSLHYELCEP